MKILKRFLDTLHWIVFIYFLLPLLVIFYYHPDNLIFEKIFNYIDYYTFLYEIIHYELIRVGSRFSYFNLEGNYNYFKIISIITITNGSVGLLKYIAFNEKNLFPFSMKKIIKWLKETLFEN